MSSSQPYLPYGRQLVDEDDIEAVVNVLRGDWLTTGPTVREFEAALAQVGGAKHAIAVNSGTSALHAAYEATGLGPGDEVIVPPMTFSATANAAVYCGATVRFADIDRDTLTLDVDSARAQVTERTKIIAPVDFTGHPADLDPIAELAASCGAVVVEDAAHTIGATYKGRPVGQIADMTCYSFHPVKTITSGEGGAILTEDDHLAARLSAFRTHGIERGPDALVGDDEPGSWAYDIHTLGYNYRITDIQCALGLSQLAKLEHFIARRREIAAHYRQLLAEVDEVELPPEADWAGHAYHLFVVRVPAERRRAIFEALRERGIGVQVHYIPVNMLRAYTDRGYRPEETPVALETYRRAISLPCFPAMQDGDVERVVRTLRDLLAQG